MTPLKTIVVALLLSTVAAGAFAQNARSGSQPSASRHHGHHHHHHKHSAHHVRR